MPFNYKYSTGGAGNGNTTYFIINNAANNDMIAVWAITSNNIPFTVTCNTQGAFANVGQFVKDTNVNFPYGYGSQMFLLQANSSAVMNVNINYSPGTPYTWVYGIYTPVGSNTVYVDSAGQTGNNTSVNPITTSYVTQNPNCLMITFCVNYSGNATFTTSGTSRSTGGAGSGIALFDQYANTPGIQTASYTSGTPKDGTMNSVAIYTYSSNPNNGAFFLLLG